MTANEQLVARLLADPDPQIKVATEHPELRKRIKIFLDGEDVTSLCRGFSIPGRRVDLYLRENGRLLLDWTCGCGTVRGTKRPASWTGPRGSDGTCTLCGEMYEVEVATEIRIGVLSVVPAPELPPQPMAARIADSVADRWFRLRLRWPAMSRHPLRYASSTISIFAISLARWIIRQILAGLRSLTGFRP